MRPEFSSYLSLPHSSASWREAFEAIRPHTAMGPLGVVLESVDRDHLALHMTITDAARQPYGLLHGGVSTLLAETAASLHACWGIDLALRFPVGIELSASHTGSADSGDVIARAEPIRVSRSLAVHEVRIRHIESDRLLSVVRVTNLYRSASS